MAGADVIRAVGWLGVLISAVVLVWYCLKASGAEVRGGRPTLLRLDTRRPNRRRAATAALNGDGSVMVGRLDIRGKVFGANRWRH
jgi:hypothetical protein